MAEYKPYKMKGHTLPGINQKSEGDTDLPDGRSGSSPFQYKKSPTKWVAAVAALAPVVMNMLKSKKKEE